MHFCTEDPWAAWESDVRDLLAKHLVYYCFWHSLGKISVFTSLFLCQRSWIAWPCAPRVTIHNGSKCYSRSTLLKLVKAKLLQLLSLFITFISHIWPINTISSLSTAQFHIHKFPINLVLNFIHILCSINAQHVNELS